jgi:hypothetical protein
MKSNHEKAFRAIYPSATIQGHKTHGGRQYFTVCKSPKGGLVAGIGSTRISAWRDAAWSLPISTPSTNETN